MQSALQSVDGVESVEIDYEAKTATVNCTGACPTGAVEKAIEGAGPFEVTVQE